MANSALESVQDKLKTENLVTAEKSYIIEPVSFQTDKLINTESPNFEATLNTKISGLAFNEDALIQLVTDRIKQTLSDDKVLESGDKQQIDYKIKTLDLTGETAVLLVHYEGIATSKINLDSLKPFLVGKNKSIISDFLKTHPEINKIDTILTPSWQQRFPYFESKISVNKAVE